ncbi:unnamed protein product [Phytomonas sp. EM1]|nr:unnamed protein product [Phytomonas sp. EM1]|eukprot:CCW60984.1 unnamed protein product [Phytomonas sp. isolate EM1]
MSTSSDHRVLSDVKNHSFPLPPRINLMQNRYPFCIVWTSIPIISWIFPFIGHVGICDSEGRIYDFQGTCHIVTDRMLFGYPLKYWDISHIYVPSFYNRPKDSVNFDDDKIQDEINAYDAAISLTKGHFCLAEHYNFFTNNCHSFVAACLNRQTIRPQRENMLTICLGIALHSKYTSWSACAAVYAPLIILVVLLAVFLIVAYSA